MSHGVFHDPEFDLDEFRSSLADWKAAGAKSVHIEWQTGPGPTVCWFPAGERRLGTTWQFHVEPARYGEEYADYIELRLIPQLAAIVRESGLEPRALCVDQQPIQIMRMRRREFERAQRASGPVGAH
jgi:hypothetical protein